MSSSHRHCLVIKDKTWKGLKAFIMNKTGDIKKGDISKWVNVAMDNLLTEKIDPITHTQKLQINPGDKFLKLKGLLLNYTLEHDQDYNPSMMTEEQLTDVIIASAARSIDITRIKLKFIRPLVALNLIEERETMGHKIYNLSPQPQPEPEAQAQLEKDEKDNIKKECDDIVSKYL